MPEYALKYADARGEIRQEIVEGSSEQEIRDRMAQQGFLVYSVRPRAALRLAPKADRARKLDIEKFLIFNQQFVTLFRAGLPILKCLDLLGDRLTDARLGPVIREIRDDVKKGSLLSEAFQRQRLFPPIYVTSIMAGERSGALGEVLERYLSYQRLALAVRKKILLSLIYPSVLVLLVIGLVVFLVTFVVPRFAELYSTTNATLPAPTRILISVGLAAEQFIVAGAVVLVLAILGGRYYLRTDAGRALADRVKVRTPVLGEIWLKYQVAQLGRLLATLLSGGIPLVQGMETASQSVDSPLLRTALAQALKRVKEGQTLSGALASTGLFPGLAIDMIEVGESTGALPHMLNSVAEFYEDDVNTRMQAALSLIEPAIMIFMGLFVAFVLVSLYLPIFSLADAMK